jgi:indolepyruvate ferredoxin oxidoreductase
MMAKMKGLRGGPLDIFGHTEERKMERRLIAEYEAGLDKLLAGLSADKLSTAVQIAQVPQQIRGFGHIKEASVKTAKAAEAKLWERWAA